VVDDLNSFRRTIESFNQEEYQIIRVEGVMEGGVGGDEWVARKQVVSRMNQIE
jgi:hypothetical protein